MQNFLPEIIFEEQKQRIWQHKVTLKMIKTIQVMGNLSFSTD
jgi:hypothetical protein